MYSISIILLFFAIAFCSPTPNEFSQLTPRGADWCLANLVTARRAALDVTIPLDHLMIQYHFPANHVPNERECPFIHDGEPNHRYQYRAWTYETVNGHFQAEFEIGMISTGARLSGEFIAGASISAFESPIHSRDVNPMPAHVQTVTITLPDNAAWTYTFSGAWHNL